MWAALSQNWICTYVRKHSGRLVAFLTSLRHRSRVCRRNTRGAIASHYRATRGLRADRKPYGSGTANTHLTQPVAQRLRFRDTQVPAQSSKRFYWARVGGGADHRKELLVLSSVMAFSPNVFVFLREPQWCRIIDFCFCIRYNKYFNVTEKKVASRRIRTAPFFPALCSRQSSSCDPAQASRPAPCSLFCGLAP